MLPGWKAHEAHIQDLLGLDSTPASGAKWQAVGDAVDNRHPSETVFPLIADAKCTEQKSFSLRAADLGSWVDRAQELGKRFIMPIRFWPRGAYGPRDYVVLTLDDFAELLEMARRNASV